MTYVATIRVLPKAEVRDPQGEAVRGALRSLGLAVSDVRTGKEIVVTFDATDEAAAREAVRVMGNELLANPVIEDYAFELRQRIAPSTLEQDPILNLAEKASFEPADVDDVVYGEGTGTARRLGRRRK
jgi:phosphoribosylformylglycinamidine synthase subunit PurS